MGGDRATPASSRARDERHRDPVPSRVRRPPVGARPQGIRGLRPVPRGSRGPYRPVVPHRRAHGSRPRALAGGRPDRAHDPAAHPPHGRLFVNTFPEAMADLVEATEPDSPGRVVFDVPAYSFNGCDVTRQVDSVRHAGMGVSFDGAAAVTRSLLGYGVVAGVFYLVVGV